MIFFIMHGYQLSVLWCIVIRDYHWLSITSVTVHCHQTLSWLSIISLGAAYCKCSCLATRAAVQFQSIHKSSYIKGPVRKGNLPVCI